MIHPYTEAMKAEFGKTGRPDCEFDNFLDEQRNAKAVQKLRPGSFEEKGADAREFFWMPYRGSNMAPTIKLGEIIIGQLQDCYTSPGIYLVLDGAGHAAYRCQLIKDQIHMSSDSNYHDEHVVPLDWFNDNVEAKVNGVYRTEI